MRDKLFRLYFTLSVGLVTVTQAQVTNHFKFSAEVLYGISAEANDFFPERDPQYSLVLGLSRTMSLPGKPTAQYPELGVLGMYTDIGNPELLGRSYAIIPYVSFPIFSSYLSGTHIQFGLGGAYFDTRFDPETNFFNQAVTTDITWAFRGSIHHHIWANNYGVLDGGIVYNHQSNGHTKLPNQGLNSFLLSLRQTWDPSRAAQKQPKSAKINQDPDMAIVTRAYLEARFGYGYNVLALAFNDLRPVRTVSLTWGKTHKGYLRWGVGAFYRFYQHYHDYIKGNESLVQPGQEFEQFRVNPWRYSSNFGVHINGEVLLGHFGISTQLGVNFYKPAYAIDWRINEGWDYPPRELPPNWVLGEYNTKYKLKKLISTRLGIRYYLFKAQVTTPNTDLDTNAKGVRINPFVGAHLNANLGQADFTELSIGVIID